MPQTQSNQIVPGTEAPDFSLPDHTGAIHTLAEFSEARALLVVFLSNRCPFVLHIRHGLAHLAQDYAGRGLAVVGINSNDAEAYPEESPESMAQEVKTAGYGFPYLKDATQDVAKSFKAACTPDFFLYDQYRRDRRLAYHGQFDDSRPKNARPVTGADLRAAIEAVLAGEAVALRQIPSIGCNIKWRSGSEPAWSSQSVAA